MIPSPRQTVGQFARSALRRMLRIFLAGVVVVVPFAFCIYVLWSIGAWLDNLGYDALKGLGMEDYFHTRPYVLGLAIVLVGIFLVGLLTHFWLFNRMIGTVERLFRHVPGVKTIYESVRDLMKLFGRDSHRMGRAVLYSPPGSGASMLAILTSGNPAGMAGAKEGQDMVTLYLPFAYMIGGQVLYVPRADIRELDMPVEKALKLAATAQVGYDPMAAENGGPPATEQE